MHQKNTHKSRENNFSFFHGLSPILPELFIKNADIVFYSSNMLKPLYVFPLEKSKKRVNGFLPSLPDCTEAVTEIRMLTKKSSLCNCCRFEYNI
jgi:hypothetical protein